MRKEFAKYLEEIMSEDDKIVLLTGDCGEGLFDKIGEQFPDRFYNLGITEQASMAMAAGMALEGMKPWFYSITTFALDRPYEFIKLDLVQQNTNVKVVGYFDYLDAGPTHITRDVSGTCANLGIKLYEPGNSAETRDMMVESYKTDGPAFFSLLKDKDI